MIVVVVVVAVAAPVVFFVVVVLVVLAVLVVTVVIALFCDIFPALFLFLLSFYLLLMLLVMVVFSSESKDNENPTKSNIYDQYIQYSSQNDCLAKWILRRPSISKHIHQESFPSVQSKHKISPTSKSSD